MRLLLEVSSTRKSLVVPKQEPLEIGKYTSMKRMLLRMKPLAKLLALVLMQLQLKNATFTFSKALTVGLEILKGEKPLS